MQTNIVFRSYSKETICENVHKSIFYLLFMSIFCFLNAFYDTIKLYFYGYF